MFPTDASGCTSAGAVSCCIASVLTAFYAAESIDATNSTPPGTVGIAPATLNPFDVCADRMQSFFPVISRAGTLRPQFWAVRGILAAVVVIGAAGVAWRWYRQGRAAIWLLQRVDGGNGRYWVLNPSVVILVPLVCFAICCELVIGSAFRTLETGNTEHLTDAILYFVLCVMFLWLAGYLQGFSLLFSVSGFLSPRPKTQIWLASPHASAIAVQRLSPRVLNAALVGLPALVFACGITGAALSDVWAKDSIRLFGQIVGQVQELGDEYAQEGGMVLPATNNADALIQRDTKFFEWQKRAILATFLTIVGFDLLYISLYFRYAWAVIAVVRRQLALMRQTSDHWVGRKQRPPPTPTRVSSPGGRDRPSLSLESREAKRKRLAMAYGGIVTLGATMVLIATVDVIFCAWGATSGSTDQRFGLLLAIVPAALWCWTLCALAAVSTLTWQAFAGYATAKPARMLATPVSPTVGATPLEEDEDEGAVESVLGVPVLQPGARAAGLHTPGGSISGSVRLPDRTWEGQSSVHQMSWEEKRWPVGQ